MHDRMWQITALAELGAMRVEARYYVSSEGHWEHVASRNVYGPYGDDSPFTDDLNGIVEALQRMIATDVD